MNYTTMYRSALFTMTALLLSSFPLAAQTALPNLMAYQAYVTDDSNNELASDGAMNYNVIFRIYDATTGGKILWAEEQVVTIFKGNFSVLLGNGQGVGDEPKPEEFDSIFNGLERYLGIKVAANNEFTPRQRILPNAYAYRARVAESVGVNSTVISLKGTSTNLSGSLNVSKATSLDSTLNVTKHTWLGGFSSSQNSDLMGNLRVGMWADASRTDNPGATGYDVTFYSQVGDGKMWWDQDERQLRLDGGSRLYVHGNAHFDSHVNTRGNFYTGIDGNGVSARFYGNTAGSYLNWNPGTNQLQLMGTANMYINDFLNVNGDTQVDNFRADGKAEIFGTLRLSSTADFNGHLDVDGYTELDGFNSSRNSSLHGTWTVNGDSSLRGHLNILDANGTKLWARFINDSGTAWHGGAYTHKLEIVEGGRAFKPSGGSWGTYSDKRLKKNIQNLDGALDKLLKLRPVTFEHKDPKKPGYVAGKQTGFIAQEVEEIFPEWVGSTRSPDQEDSILYKTISVTGFEALAVQAISELRAEKDTQNEVQTAQIKALKEANSALETRLDRLEALLEERVSGATNGSN
jgi:hypothetical protein